MRKEMGNDPFDEFEFRPMTEGLGFHKKAIHLQDEVQASGLMDTADAGDIPLVPNALLDDKPPPPRYRSPNLQQPLPREKTTGKTDASQALKNIEPQLPLDFTQTTLTPTLDKEILRQKTTTPVYEKIPTRMVAAVFDGVVAFTLAIIFLVTMMTVTQVDLIGVFFNSQTQLVIQGSLALMYVSILQLYTVISRSITGSTLGEWAFDIHLAQKDGQRSVYFPFLVIWRSTLNLCTGMILLPFISLIVRKDVASFLTGTQLYQQK